MSSGVIVSTVVTRSTYVFSHLELVLMQSEANKMKFDGHYSKDYRRQVRCYISKLLQDYIHSRSGCALAIERDMGTVWRHIRDMVCLMLGHFFWIETNVVVVLCFAHTHTHSSTRRLTRTIPSRWCELFTTNQLIAKPDLKRSCSSWDVWGTLTDRWFQCDTSPKVFVAQHTSYMKRLSVVFYLFSKSFCNEFANSSNVPFPSRKSVEMIEKVSIL